MDLLFDFMVAQGADIVGQYTVNWYQKDSDDIIATGTTLTGYDETVQYQYEIILGEQLSHQYYQPARKDVVLTDGSNTLQTVLNEINQITISGMITDENGAAIAELKKLPSWTLAELMQESWYELYKISNPDFKLRISAA